MRRSGIGSRCLLGLLVLVWASLAASTHWPLGLGNPCTALAAGAEGTLKWKFYIGGLFNANSSPAISSDGTIYVGSNDTYLYAINPDGSLIWKFKTEASVMSSPAISSDGTIYVGSHDSYLYAINPNGSLTWKFKTGDRVASSPAISSDGTIYVGSEDTYFYAITPDGSLIWKFKTGDTVASSPAIGSDGTIYVGSLDNYLYAINRDGTLKWKFKTGGYVGLSSPAIGSDGTIYVGSEDTYFYAINPDGTLRWKFETDVLSGNLGHPVIGSDGTVYVVWGASNAYCSAINPEGSLKWKFKSGSTVGAPAIGYDGTIYVGGQGRNSELSFYAINPDGIVKWVFMTHGYLESSPAIDSDGTIYFALSDGYLYAINSSSMGLAASPWPMFHHDERHTGLAGIAFGSSFFATPRRGAVPLTVKFTDRSSGEFNSWLWDFGDGSTSTKRNPSHVYTEVGDYTVSLTVAGPDGEDTATRENYIRVGLEVNASFTATPTAGPVPLTVQFTDESDGTIDTWQWDFGDGSTSTKRNPSHVYSKAGDYTVSLTVTGPAGGDVQTRTDYIRVGVTAAFSATPKSGAAPLTVDFTDRSTGEIDSRLWDFGDGSTSTEQSPSHVYPHAGAYTVSLTVTGPEGTDTEIKEDCILVGSERMYVPDDFSTIQDAIDAAIDQVSTIIVRDGTYAGAGNVNLDFKGKEITVRSENGPEKSIIDGGNSAVGFNFHSGEKEGSVLSGFTIRNCKSSYGGGAIRSKGSSPTIRYCVITGNSAARGAGIYIEKGSPVITDCVISDNLATQEGGGIYSTASMAGITACTITGNSAVSGAGIFLAGGSPVLTDCTISGNHADTAGGGIQCKRSAARITGCTIAWNTAGAQGAGVLSDGAPSPRFSGCKIANNTAQTLGGGISFRLGSSAAIVNCLIAGNTAMSGGGLSIKDSSPAITNSTIVGNSARGIVCYGASKPAIANSILWGNQTREILRNTTLGHRPRPRVTYSNIKGGYPGEGNMDANPMFVAPASGDYHLAVGSPSINTGNNDALNVPLTDRDGHPRIMEGVVDMGAYEYQGN